MELNVFFNDKENFVFHANTTYKLKLIMNSIVDKGRL